ncbi:asparagine synthase (glutamine-hydrolyzing) [Pontimicrobium sp. MEBiC01747]
MCGIVGYISKAGYRDTLEDKLEAIKHRGPDGKGLYESFNETCNVGLGHVRLSIIDLSEKANQPFYSNCNKYVIIFNGEIYNYKKLKDKYLKDVVFKTESDTEVLLQLYILKGKAILNELNGMFAFAIYNVDDESLFIARDQLGIKPLYYYYDKDKFIFSSEIKALWKFAGVKKEIDESSYTEFLLNGFLYEPDTGFKNINKLELGSSITINDTFNILIEKYWDLNCNEKNIANPTETFNLKIKDSIEEHLESDVPVGLFFSGGVDSTIILNKVKDTIQPIVVKSSQEDSKDSGQTNDYFYAKKVANSLNVELETIELDEEIKNTDDFLKQIDFLSKATEEPISDYTFISSQIISKRSKETGYTVMLSGMGADEIFGGYPRYKMVKYDKLFGVINKLVPDILLKRKSFEKKIQRFKTYFNYKEFGLKYASLVGYFSLKELDDLILDKADASAYLTKTNKYLENVPNASKLKKAMYLDLYGFLSHNFLVADKSSMLESLELRVPLATKDLMEQTFNIKSSALLKFNDTKIILKKLLLKAGFAKDIIYRKKAGFNPPLDNLIKNLGIQKIRKVLETNGFFKSFNIKSVDIILENHFNGKENNTYKIFQLLYLSFWIKNNAL